jgi:hypothetical protein
LDDPEAAEKEIAISFITPLSIVQSFTPVLDNA